MYSVSIVIVNWNTGETLKKCLDSIEILSENNYKLDEVIIVDNASVDHSQDLFSLNYSFVLKVIHNQVNNGFAKACNQGAKQVHSDYILFLNPDMILFEDTLDRSFCYLNNENIEKIGAFGVRIIDDQGNTLRTCSRLPKIRYYFAKCFGINKFIKRWNTFMLEWDHKESKNVDEVIGAFFMVNRKQFEDMQGFDERFFVYYEEVDYCKRLREKGYNVYFYADAIAFHEGGAASNKVKDFRLFYELRSRYLYEQKHCGNILASVTKSFIAIEYISRSLYLVKTKRFDEIHSVQRAYKMFNEWYKQEMRKT